MPRIDQPREIFRIAKKPRKKLKRLSFSEGAQTPSPDNTELQQRRLLDEETENWLFAHESNQRKDLNFELIRTTRSSRTQVIRGYVDS